MLPTVLDTSGGPGDTQPDYESGRAPAGARVMVLDTSGGPEDTQPGHESGRAPAGARVMVKGVNRFGFGLIGTSQLVPFC